VAVDCARGQKEPLSRSPIVVILGSGVEVSSKSKECVILDSNRCDLVLRVVELPWYVGEARRPRPRGSPLLEAQ
jgi:hypothetical protein